MRVGHGSSSSHVHHAHHLDTCVGFEPVGRQSVVEGLKEARLAGEVGAWGKRGLLGAEVEGVDCGRKKKGKLEGRANRDEAVGCRVVGWEDGDVEGVVLGTLAEALKCRVGEDLHSDR